MSDDAKQKVSNYLSSHPYLNLATVSADGTPIAHTVGFVSEDADVYFMTDKNTRKAKNITSNPSVAYTVDEDQLDISRIQGIQMRGKASLVTDSTVIDKVSALLAEKYPFMKEMPVNPDYVLFRIDPVEALFIDNTVGFGHRDIAEY